MNAPRTETVGTRGSLRPKIASEAQELEITIGIDTDTGIGMDGRKRENRLVNVAEIMGTETSPEIAIEPGIETAVKTTQRATTGTRIEIETGIVKGLAK
jgi:hypothetical protein